MDDSPWIMSEGGPLLCVEEALRLGWKGIHASSLSSGDLDSDYDRISRICSYIEALPMQGGLGLALGEGPLDSRFWRSAATQQLHILRIDCCEANFQESIYMAAFDNEASALQPVEELRFTIATPRLVMFDSADGGDDLGMRSVSTDAEPGVYSIKTFRYEPDASASLVVHRFDRLG